MSRCARRATRKFRDTMRGAPHRAIVTSTDAPREDCRVARALKFFRVDLDRSLSR
jgi:hypothetical protein